MILVPYPEEQATRALAGHSICVLYVEQQETGQPLRREEQKRKDRRAAEAQMLLLSCWHQKQAVFLLAENYSRMVLLSLI
jgi:hypothetical protein